MSTAGTVNEALQGLGGGRHGHLRYINATTLRFIPWLGDRIKINGAWYAIPAAGLTITNSGATASTLLYVYAYWTGSALAAEFSTTGHSPSAVDANAGVEIKTGDATRSLIGMVRVDASSQFFDREDRRWVRSWFNRHLDKRSLNYSGNGQVSTVSASPVVMSPAWLVAFLSWAGEVITATLFCSCWNNTANTGSFIAFQWTTDGFLLSGHAGVSNSDATSQWQNVSHTFKNSYATDGERIITPYFWTLGGLTAGVNPAGPFPQINGRIS